MTASPRPRPALTSVGLAALALTLASAPSGARGDVVVGPPRAEKVGPLVVTPRREPPPPRPAASSTSPPLATARPAPSSPSSASSPSSEPAAPPSFADGLPTAASDAPTADEWRTAPEVAPTRTGPRAAGCHVLRVREWLRVSCPELETASIAVLGGTTTGYAFWIDPAKEGQDGKLPAGGEILFPMRRGDRRVVQMLTFGPGYEGPLTQLPALVVQAHWLDDEPVPVLTVL